MICFAHKALDFCKNSNRFVTKPPFAYEITAPAALALLMNLSYIAFHPLTVLLICYRHFYYFQQLTKFHSKDVDPSAYIDIDIERLEWVKKISTINRNGFII